MLGRAAHDRIVQTLYAAAAGEVGWAGALALAAGGFGYSAGVMTLYDAGTGSMQAEAHGRPNDFADAYYRSETFRRDPRAAIHMAVRPGQVYHDHALYDVRAMLRDDRVRASIAMIGVAHQIGLSLRLPGPASAMFTLLSTEDEGAPDEAAVAAFRRLAPHIEQAGALGTMIARDAATQAALLEALAAGADGVMLLDAAGKPAFVNDRARAILAAGDGLAWSAEGFTTARGQETRRLRCAVASALAARGGPGEGTPGGQTLVSRPSGRLCYIVRVLPAPPVERLLARYAFACVVHIHDLGAPHLPDRA